MMKMIKLQPFLLVMLLVFIPRNSSSNGISSHSGKIEGALESIQGSTVIGPPEGADTNVPSPAVKQTLEILELYAKTFDWLQNKILRSKFNETTVNLDNTMINLPGKLAKNRAQILNGLYRTVDRINIGKRILINAANSLKSLCDRYINIINRNDASQRFLNYITNNMKKKLKAVNDIFSDALNKFIEVRKELSGTESNIKVLNNTLNLEKDNIEKTVGKKLISKEDIQPIITHSLSLKTEEIPDTLKDIIKINRVHELQLKIMDMLIVQQEMPSEIKIHRNIEELEEQQVVPGETNVLENTDELEVQQEIPSEVEVLQEITSDSNYTLKPCIRQIDDSSPLLMISNDTLLSQRNKMVEGFNKWSRFTIISYTILFDLDDKLTRNIENMNKIEKVQESIDVYLSQVKQIDQYIEREKEFITKRQNIIIEQEDLSIEDIKSCLTALDLKFKDLKKSSTDYLNTFG